MTRDYSFIQPLTAERIEENFKEDCARYGTHKLAYLHQSIPELAAAAKRAEIPLMTEQKIGKNSWLLTHYLWCDEELEQKVWGRVAKTKPLVPAP